jgi:hypothetical protein
MTHEGGTAKRESGNTMGYSPRVYKTDGGNKMVVASGGSVEFETGSALIAPNPSGAQDYYVDLNASTASTAGAMATYDATVDGKSWASAFQLISSAIAASNTSIGLTANRWWARRNRIFVCGDVMTESLTVLPEKCDIIGVGTDLRAFPRVYGNHTIALAKVGCRFINMGFVTTGTGDLFVIPAGCHVRAWDHVHEGAGDHEFGVRADRGQPIQRQCRRHEQDLRRGHLDRGHDLS